MQGKGERGNAGKGEQGGLMGKAGGGKGLRLCTAEAFAYRRPAASRPRWLCDGRRALGRVGGAAGAQATKKHTQK